MNVWQNVEQYPVIQRHPSLFEFLKFCVVGVSGTIVDFGVYALLTRVAGLYYLYATAISVFLAILNNFLFNKYWTFKKGSSGKTGTEYAKFFTVSLINYFLNIGIVYAIVELTSAEAVFGRNEDFFAKVVAIAVVLLSNYLGNKFWTFKE